MSVNHILNFVAKSVVHIFNTHVLALFKTYKLVSIPVYLIKTCRINFLKMALLFVTYVHVEL